MKDLLESIGWGHFIVAAIASILSFFISRLWFRADDALPEHLLSRVAERITEASARVEKAKKELEAANKRFAATKRAADAASPADSAAAEKSQRAEDDVADAKEVLEYEQAQLDRLLNPNRFRWLEGIHWASVAQYLVFGLLALFVLHHLMDGLTRSPAAGTTPRTMITFLIAVVTVGIALILVLATIVSNSEDRERRFSQGKEVLTALLGVLGTIVGFYFGTSQEHVQGFDFEPIVINQEAEDLVTVSTSVTGGKGPYTFSALFEPSEISLPESKISDDGNFTFDLRKPKEETKTSVTIRVMDAEGRTGSIKETEILKPAGSDRPPDGGEGPVDSATLN